MSPTDDIYVKQLGPPAVFAASVRSGYKMFFYPSVICVGTAVFFAVWHHPNWWILSVAFAASALMYFPVSLSQYRHSKQITEKTIRNYEKWYSERVPDGEGR